MGDKTLINADLAKAMHHLYERVTPTDDWQRKICTLERR
jgi:hypothetical protein